MEEVFLLQYYLGMSYEVARRLPIQYRSWHLQRLQKEINKQTANGGEDTNSRAPHNNDPLQQSFNGRLPGTPMSRRR